MRGRHENHSFEQANLSLYLSGDECASMPHVIVPIGQRTADSGRTTHLGSFLQASERRRPFARGNHRWRKTRFSQAIRSNDQNHEVSTQISFKAAFKALSVPSYPASPARLAIRPPTAALPPPHLSRLSPARRDPTAAGPYGLATCHPAGCAPIQGWVPVPACD